MRKQGEASTEWLQRILDHAGFSSNASAVSNPDELNGADEEDGSEDGSVSEESLIAQSTQNGTLAVLTICRTLNEIWRERCSKAFGGSFRYKVQRNEHGGKYAVGINVAGKPSQLCEGSCWSGFDPPRLRRFSNCQRRKFVMTLNADSRLAWRRLLRLWFWV